MLGRSRILADFSKIALTNIAFCGLTPEPHENAEENAKGQAFPHPLARRRTTNFFLPYEPGRCRWNCQLKYISASGLSLLGCATEPEMELVSERVPWKVRGRPRTFARSLVAKR